MTSLVKREPGAVKEEHGGSVSSASGDYAGDELGPRERQALREEGKAMEQLFRKAVAEHTQQGSPSFDVDTRFSSLGDVVERLAA